MTRWSPFYVALASLLGCQAIPVNQEEANIPAVIERWDGYYKANNPISNPCIVLSMSTEMIYVHHKLTDEQRRIFALQMIHLKSLCLIEQGIREASLSPD